MKVILSSAVASSLAMVVAAECQADTCFKSVRLAPILNKAASIFCLNYVKPTPNLTTTKTLVVTRTDAKTGSTPTQTATVTATATVTSGSSCTATISGYEAFTQTVTNFAAPSGAIRKREHDLDLEAEDLAKRELSAVPNNLMAGCKETGRALTAKISSACTCFLTPTATRTVTSTAIVSKSVTPNAVTVQTTITNTITTQSCTSTSTLLPSCGVPIKAKSYTSGTVTCSNTATAPSANALLRIEGSDSEGTIFEGCIKSGPRDITTPSGGTHKCDGTNLNTNPQPGTTCTTELDAAAALLGFPYDGTYSTQFEDYFITSIGQSTQTSTQFWGVLVNEQFTAVAGCQQQVKNGDRTLWAFDAFNKVYFLKLSPNYAAVAPGSIVSTTVTDGSSGQPVSGASIFGTLSNAAGQVTFTAPTAPGCYLYKATRADSLRSETFYLSVF